MIQSVFTNRYGKSSWTDVTFYFINMVILLYMTNSFDNTSLANMTTFFLAASLLSFSLLLQYLVVYLKSNNQVNKNIAKAFCEILLLRAIVLLIGGLFNYSWAQAIAIIGIIISWILPAFTGKYTRKHPIIFSHLLERLTLLIIITFGETIIGISDYFKPGTFSVNSVLIFVIVAALFFAYITEFDHLIEEKRTNETRNTLIYLHYLILFGLSLVTVSLKFISEKDANMSFVISCLYGGMLLFYCGLIIAKPYNKKRYQNVKPFDLLIMLLALILGYVISLIFQSFEVIVIVATVVSLLNAAMRVKRLYI